MERLVEANGIELCYETFGDAADDPLLLIMGFTAQLTAWHEEFCESLAERGLYVIRYDNRDVGRSTKTEGPLPDIMALMGTLQAGGSVDPDEVAYTLSDMAADAAGLLDALDIETAHIVGASMGGMILQHLAFERPERLRSATSIMSTTGNPEVGQASDESLGALLTPAPPQRDPFVEHSVRVSRQIAGPLWVEEEARTRAGAAFDRMYHPQGAAFQMAAIVASGDRTERLGSVSTPFCVVHGEADSLIDVSGGRATAAAIDGAELVILDEMGHDLPRSLWPDVVDAIWATTKRAA